MQTIHSRTTVERLIRATLLVVLVNGFALAYLWDGYVGYARDNVEALVNTLGLNTQLYPPVDPTMTEQRGTALAGEIKNRTPLRDVTAQLGEPALEHDGSLYFIGPGGHLRIALNRGFVTAVEWNRGNHSESDLLWQRGIGFVLVLCGVFALVHFVRVVRTRVVLTSESLAVGGQPPVPLQAITGVNLVADARAELIAITYDDNGRSGELQLSGYVVKELPAIVAALCAYKGLANPLAAASDEPGEAANGDSRDAD